jgi:hypothetical protein
VKLFGKQLLAALRITLALLAVMALILASVAAVAPGLHANLHPEASHDGWPAADHQCAAVSFAKGSVESAEATPPPTDIFLYFTEPAPPLQHVPLPTEEYLLLPGRAPPVWVLFTFV